MIKKRQKKNLNQILLSGYSSVDSEEVDQAEGASDQAKRGYGRHLQVYRYLRAWFYRISFEPVERGPCPKKYAIIVIPVPSLYAILLPNCSIEQSQDTGGGEPTDVSKILNWPMV